MKLENIETSELIECYKVIEEYLNELNKEKSVGNA